MSEQEDDKAWHLDKRVPITLIVTILAQTAGTMWWAAKMDARVEYLERQQTAAPQQTERVIRMETKIEGMRDDISEIKTLLRARRSESSQ